MSYYIPDSVKTLVAERAAYRCEYCRMPQSYAHYRFHYEHIIALQHGGATILIIWRMRVLSVIGRKALI